tara:strand:+ start:48324 stop:49484 length:1161 start_codon:yes stop_codon:yes gene_type:complete
MNTSELQKFLETANIPRIKKKPKTFLGIAKQPHYENVLSNILGFYFNTKEVHQLEDLFIKSLKELIKESKLGTQKKAIQGLFEFSVDTECATDGGGRIDLLLSNETHAIIIENKVYHHIKDNDLDDYWDSVKVECGDENNKVGIILSLYPISQHHYSKFKSTEHYINITHLSLLKCVLKNSGNYLLNANDKYVVFLKDLVQNISNLSSTYMEPKDISFYFKHQLEINELATFKFSVRKHIIAETEKAGAILNGVNVLAPRANSFNEKRVRYYVSPKHQSLMIAVVFDDLLKPERQMHIAVELNNELLKDRSIYNEITTFTDKELEIAYSENFRTTNYSWSHFAVKHYNPTENEVAHLSEFIAKKLKEDNLLSIFNKLDAFLSARKN